MSSKFISQIKEFGINPSKIHRNLSVEKLLEAATQKNEGMITSTGSLSVKTGKYTGRSPDDRFIVFDDLTHDKVHWAKVNKQIPTETFEKLSQKMKKFVDGKELYIFDGFVGADPENRLPIRVINDHAWQSLFVHQLLIRPSATELESHEPEFTIICINDFEAIPEVDGTSSNAFILINLSKKLVLIGTTNYAGEIKKAIFSTNNNINKISLEITNRAEDKTMLLLSKNFIFSSLLTILQFIPYIFNLKPISLQRYFQIQLLFCMISNP